MNRRDSLRRSTRAAATAAWLASVGGRGVEGMRTDFDYGECLDLAVST